MATVQTFEVLSDNLHMMLILAVFFVLLIKCLFSVMYYMIQ